MQEIVTSKLSRDIPQKWHVPEKARTCLFKTYYRLAWRRNIDQGHKQQG
jgi:hypothetical protein